MLFRYTKSRRSTYIANRNERVQLWVEPLDLTEAGFGQGLRRERSILHLLQGFMNGKKIYFSHAIYYNSRYA